jgi:hypothetical protein
MTTQPGSPEKGGNQVRMINFLKKSGKVLGLLLGSLLFLFVLFNLLLRISYFQKSVVSGVSYSVSALLGTQVRMERISLSGLTEFKINKFYLEDPDRDTFFFADRIYARLHPNILKIFTDGLIIYQLKISDGQLYVKELKNRDIHSLAWFLDKFKKKKNSVKSGSFKIYPEIFNLERVRITQDEPGKKLFNRLFLPELNLRLSDHYAMEQALKIRDIEMIQPQILIKSWKDKDSLRATKAFDLPVFDISWKNLKVKKGLLEVITQGKKFRFSDIDMEVVDACYLNSMAEAGIKNISFEHAENLNLRKFSVKQISLVDNKLIASGLGLSVGASDFEGDFKLFSDRLFDFKNFKDHVQVDLKFYKNRLFIRDLLKVLPTSSNLKVFDAIKNESVSFSGNISGNVNRLMGSGLKLSVSDGSSFDGKINFRNLLKPTEELINLKCRSLYIAPKMLEKSVSLLKLDTGVTKLEYLQFNGSFDGFFNNFVAFGTITSGLGSAKLDMQLNLLGGKDQATYRGNIALNSFKLGQLLNQPDWGNLALQAAIYEGKGFSPKTASAKISASIHEIEFKKYSYKNAILEGTLNAKKFNGELNIKEEHIDFDFDGSIDFTNDAVPTFNFAADLKKMDLKALKLSKNPWSIHGSAVIDVKNKKWSDLEGIAVLSGFQVRNDTAVYELDHLSFISALDAEGRKRVEIQSEILEADIEGKFDIEKIPNAATNFLFDAFPDFSKVLALKRARNIPEDFDVRFQAKIKRSDGWEELLLPGLSHLNGAEIKGVFDQKKKNSNVQVTLPNFKLRDLNLNGVYVQGFLNNGIGRLDASVSGIKIGEQTELPPFLFLSKLRKDEINFLTRLGQDQKSKQPLLELNGKLNTTKKDQIALKLIHHNANLLATKWKIDPNNLILFSSKEYDIQNMNFSSKEEAFQISRFKQKGIKVSLKNIELSRIDAFIKFAIKFSGKLQADVSFDDWKGFKNLTFTAHSDTFKMNKKDWGYMKIQGRRPTENHPLSAQFSLVKGTAALHLSAFYNIKEFDIAREKEKGYFDLQLNAYNFPNHFAGYFLEGILSNIQGTFDADMHFDGKFPKLNTAGTIFLSAGGVTVDYLKTRYTYKPTMVPVNNQLFDLTGGILYDKYNHTALITGGVSHDFLKKFGFKAKLSSKRFLCLDTQKGDNPTYYGQAMGTGDVLFSGTFKLPDIYVKASVSDSTRVVIPISSEIATQNIKNIRFVNKQKEDSGNGIVKSRPILKGLSFDMDLEAKPGAVLEVVFNEQTGDILRVTGRGGARLSVLRNEPFKMYGDISIDEGSYLFTYLTINKNFKLRPRGTISWNGDPYKALINIEATYEDIYASTAVLIQEFLLTASQSVKSEAAQNTQVTLILKLQGDLFKPDITFDLAFPALQGALDNYVESKLRILKQDQNELNKQVFGLIVAGQFLPAVFSMSETAIIYNTVSEFVSNQLSNLVNQLISNLIGKGELDSGTNFDIAFNRNPNFVISNFKAGNELQVSLKQSLFNDKVTILVGGNLDNNFFGGASTSTTFLGNDLVIDYTLSKDKSLTFRVYQRLQPDFSGRRLRFGAGVSYRKEFESFADFLNSLKKNN